MGFQEFLGNERIVAALRGALRTKRVPHALLFTGPRGVGKFTLARMFAQAANCERVTDDVCGECPTCHRISLLANPQDRKSTRLNSSHLAISYAVFCLKKKNKKPK